jgi:hypothetical protein
MYCINASTTETKVGSGRNQRQECRSVLACWGFLLREPVAVFLGEMAEAKAVRLR